MQELSDDLIVKAQEGDIGSFEIIYKATAGFVYNVAYRVVYNAQDAEEITQEVFLKIDECLACGAVPQDDPFHAVVADDSAPKRIIAIQN